MAKGPSETMGLTKSHTLTVLIFGGYVHLAVSIFFAKVSWGLFFGKATKSCSPNLFVCFLHLYKWEEHLVLTLEIHFDVLISQFKSQNVLGSQRKMLASPSHKVSIFHLPPLIYSHPFATFSFIPFLVYMYVLICRANSSKCLQTAVFSLLLNFEGFCSCS